MQYFGEPEGRVKIQMMSKNLQRYYSHTKMSNKIYVFKWSYHRETTIFEEMNKLIKNISIYTLSDLDYSSNLIGSLSRANAALFTRYRVDNALSHKTKWPA